MFIMGKLSTIYYLHFTTYNVHSTVQYTLYSVQRIWCDILLYNIINNNNIY